MAARDIFDNPAMPRRLVICTGPCCDHSGTATANLEELRRMLSVRTPGEERVYKGSCVRRSCLGKCSGEPLAHVEPDDVWYVGSSAQALLRIYEEHVLGDKPVSEFLLVEEV